MKVFVTGVNGQLGHDMMLELQRRGHNAVGSGSGPAYRGSDGVASGRGSTWMGAGAAL